MSSGARAEDRYFIGLPTGGDGNWSDPSNWSGAGLPGPDDVTRIVDSDAFDRFITLDASAGVAELYIGNTGGGRTTLYQNGDFNLTTPYEALGHGLTPGDSYYVPNSHAMHVQNGGANDIGQLTLGDYNSFQAPSSGHYVLNGGMLHVSQVFVAYAGQGTFEQNGGTVNASGSEIGSFPEAVGIYKLSGGMLNVSGVEYVGFGGVGTFLHSGGTHVSEGTLWVGMTAAGLSPSWGTYILNGADATLIGNVELIGRHAGTFIQSAGYHEVRSLCVVGYTNGSYDMSGGEFRVLGELDVGLYGTGTFNHSGGSVTVGSISTTNNGLLLIGATQGVYNLTGESANLTVWGTEYIGNGVGAFSQSAGNHAVSQDLILAGYSADYSSRYLLAGGTLNVGGSLRIGTDSPGVFLQSGGTNVVAGSIVMGFNGMPPLGGASTGISDLDIEPVLTWHGTYTLAGG